MVESIDSGMYIERLFPAMGVRFIAINDGIDSGEEKSQSDEIIIPFKNLITMLTVEIFLLKFVLIWRLRESRGCNHCICCVWLQKE